MNNLWELAWSDLCVSPALKTSWYKETPDAMIASSLPEALEADLAELWAALETEWSRRKGQVSPYGFAMTWPPSGGARIRAKRIPLADGRHVYICRAFRFEPKKFAEIGMSPPLAARLLSPDIRSGIGIFLGPPGAGKTTAASAYISERARRYGGVTWTIETPVEIRLEGRHEKGYIHQREVDSIALMADAIDDIARATPNVLFVGEVIDQATAEMVVRAAQMGFLVLCTAHGGTIFDGLERFALAAGRGKVSTQFADSFRFAIHLDLRLADTGGQPKPINDSVIDGMATGNPPRVLHTKSLISMKDDDPFRSYIRSGDFAKLSSEVDRQKNELLKDLDRIKSRPPGQPR